MAPSMVKDCALFADWLYAGFTEELQDIGLVSGTIDGFLCLATPIFFFIALNLAQTCHPVSFKTMHELVSHDAVGTQEICTIEAPCHSVGFFAFAARTV